MYQIYVLLYLGILFLNLFLIKYFILVKIQKNLKFLCLNIYFFKSILCLYMCLYLHDKDFKLYKILLVIKYNILHTWNKNI